MSNSIQYSINIDSCYCEKKSFASLLTIAQAENLDLLALAKREGCGTHCGWCVAYLRRGLRTGETVFHTLMDKEPLYPPTANDTETT